MAGQVITDRFARRSLVLSIVVSTVVYFVAGYFIKRRLDEIQVPRSITRSFVIFCFALGIAYGVAMIIDWLVP